VPKQVLSTSTSKEENELLLKTLHQSAQQRHHQADVTEDEIIKSLVDQHAEELSFTYIDLKKTWKVGSTGRELTNQSLDKSWYLNHLLVTEYKGDNQFLGEFQLAYTLMIIFANFSGCQQWKKQLELILRCRKDLVDHPGRFIEFLTIVYHQIKMCPAEYIDEFLERPFLETVFRHFWRTLTNKTPSQLEPYLTVPPQVIAVAARVFDALHVHGIVVPRAAKSLLKSNSDCDSEDEDEDEDERAVIVE